MCKYKNKITRYNSETQYIWIICILPYEENVLCYLFLYILFTYNTVIPMCFIITAIDNKVELREKKIT